MLSCVALCAFSGDASAASQGTPEQRYTSFVHMPKELTRRNMLASALGAAAVAPLLAQTKRDWTGKDPMSYPDPDIVVLDPKRFKYKINNSVIERVFVGCRWA